MGDSKTLGALSRLPHHLVPWSGVGVAVGLIGYGLARGPSDHLSIWSELGFFLLGSAVARYAPRPWRRGLMRQGSELGTQASATGDEPQPASSQLMPLPQGAQSLLAILARALGDAEAALYVRQGSRLVCRSQEPKTFGAQQLAPALWAYLHKHRQPPGAPLLWEATAPQKNARGPHKEVAVPLYLDQQGEPELQEPAVPWAVLYARRRGGPFAEADLSLVKSVAEQVAVSLQLEQALRHAQADKMRLEHMATTDSLTELANRRHFMRTFALQLARSKRYHRRLSLIFLDIDHFKQVNDTFGHGVGDEVLRGVANVLRKTARGTDTVARYGGEEFAILMEETGPEGAQCIAERIQRALKKQPFGPERSPFFKTVSIGVATFPEHGDEPEQLIASADDALYQAKRSGRDRITLYRGPTMACLSETR